MNPINRVGQKVVCVMEFEIYDYRGVMFCGPQPVQDEVYTVAGFMSNDGIAAALDHDVGDLGPALELKEIPALIGSGGTRHFGWPIIGFRPVDERETDISALVEAANNIPATGLEADLIRSPYVAEPVE